MALVFNSITLLIETAFASRRKAIPGKRRITKVENLLGFQWERLFYPLYFFCLFFGRPGTLKAGEMNPCFPCLGSGAGGGIFPDYSRD
jgi:hypothetical protein